MPRRLQPSDTPLQRSQVDHHVLEDSPVVGGAHNERFVGNGCEVVDSEAGVAGLLAQKTALVKKQTVATGVYRIRLDGVVADQRANVEQAVGEHYRRDGLRGGVDQESFHVLIDSARGSLSGVADQTFPGSILEPNVPNQ